MTDISLQIYYTFSEGKLKSLTFGNTIYHESFVVFTVFSMSAKLFCMKVQDGAVQIWI